ncbi:hypothetical protein IW140_001425 [Coemansia sp. RSA 1813]|nr:hypothetical protein LPJ74_005716 [Coemansia sp. RSA 1843]KAJ2091820.1 hypothetical protein IW138_001509 [Coemansia sp. RSA 986]KAJ2215854.1 hypothetical protein EV179_001874 [Coemansia sp. RSA 487]KAJ2571784.1 hypothetical protein IW140_001425 [Coemansia sp. RSA 1813]
MDSDAKPGTTSTRVGDTTVRAHEDADAERRAERVDAESRASSFLKNMSQSLRDAKLIHDEPERRSRSPRRARRQSPSSTRPRSRSSTRRRREYSRDERIYRDHYDRHRDDRDRSYRRRSRSRDSRREQNRSRRKYPSRSRDRSRRRDEEVIPLHLRPKKLSFWDMAPPGFEGISCLEAKASGLFPPPGQAAGSRNVASFNPSVLFEHTHKNENDRFRPSSRGEREFPSTASRQARRLYVGNIPIGIDEDSIASFFNDLMVRLNIATNDELPVQNIQINIDKNYAFVELRDANQATMGMGLDGVMFQNQKLKIRRPKDYIPPPGQDEPKPPTFALPGVLSNMVPDSPNKVYVGGLPTYLSEDQVIELLRAFGELKAFNLVRDSVMRVSRGFAFCEYEDPNVTDIACQGLNGMDLGDKRLVVQRASLGARGGGDGGQQDRRPQHQNQQPGQSQHQQQYQQPGHQNRGHRYPPDQYAQHNGYAQRQMAPPPPPHMAPAMHGQPPAGSVPGMQATPIVQLLNMVTEGELEDDEEYADIVDDVRDECSNYGSVVDLRIPRNENMQADIKTPGVGKIFVQYASPAEATAALNALAGRQFMGRTVIASYITEDDFANRRY